MVDAAAAIEIARRESEPLAQRHHVRDGLLICRGMASDLPQMEVQPLDRKPCALEVALGFHDVGLVHPELAAVPCIPRIPFRRDMTAEPDAPSLLDSLGGGAQ